MSLSAITSFEFNLRGGQYSESSRGKMLLLLLKTLFISVVRVVEMGYLLSVNIVWKCHPLILSMFSTKQTVQDEKYLLFVNIENGCPSPPLNSYVYISYQAKHPFNFSNIKEDNHKYKSANFSDIKNLPNLTRYCDCTKYFLCKHTASLPSPSI